MLQKKQKTGKTKGAKRKRNSQGDENGGAKKKNKKERLQELTPEDLDVEIDDQSPLPTDIFKGAYKSIIRDDGTTINVPDSRFPTLYTFTFKKPRQKFGVADQGPHTVAHVLTDSLFAEAIGDSSIATLQDFFDTHIPSPDDLLEILKSEEINFFDRTLQPRFQRYFTYYKDLHEMIAKTLASKGKINEDDLIVNLRAIMELHPYQTYGWKTTGRVSEKSTHGKGERLPGLLNLSDEAIRKMIDGKRASTFRDKEAFYTFIRERLGIYYADARVDSVMKPIEGTASTVGDKSEVDNSDEDE